MITRSPKDIVSEIRSYFPRGSAFFFNPENPTYNEWIKKQADTTNYKDRYLECPLTYYLEKDFNKYAKLVVPHLYNDMLIPFLIEDYNYIATEILRDLINCKLFESFGGVTNDQYEAFNKIGLDKLTIKISHFSDGVYSQNIFYDDILLSNNRLDNDDFKIKEEYLKPALYNSITSPLLLNKTANPFFKEIAYLFSATFFDNPK